MLIVWPVSVNAQRFCCFRLQWLGKRLRDGQHNALFQSGGDIGSNSSCRCQPRWLRGGCAPANGRSLAGGARTPVAMDDNIYAGAPSAGPAEPPPPGVQHSDAAKITVDDGVGSDTPDWVVTPHVAGRKNAAA